MAKRHPEISRYPKHLRLCPCNCSSPANFFQRSGTGALTSAGSLTQTMLPGIGNSPPCICWRQVIPDSLLLALATDRACVEKAKQI